VDEVSQLLSRSNRYDTPGDWRGRRLQSGSRQRRRGGAIASWRPSHISLLILAWTVAAPTLATVGDGGEYDGSPVSSPQLLLRLRVRVPELPGSGDGARFARTSHVNDAGCWLIKEFFNMDGPQTLKTWTVAETIIGVAGRFHVLLSLPQ